MNAMIPAAGPILVVDDDRLVLLTLVEALRQAGYTVLEADNGDEAILLAREHRPALAVLDIRMQGLSGFDVAQYLRDQLQTPFVFVSAFADPGIRQQAQALGAKQLLTKPVQSQVLLQTVEAALASGSTRSLVGLAGSAVGSSSGSGATPPAAAPGGAVPNRLDSGQAGEVFDAVPVAVGILMHRHGLTRQQALNRLQMLVAHHGGSVPALALTLVQAQETLAATAATS